MGAEYVIFISALISPIREWERDGAGEFRVGTLAIGLVEHLFVHRSRVTLCLRACRYTCIPTGASSCQVIA